MSIPLGNFSNVEFAYFTIPKIKTYINGDGKEKKKLIGMPLAWTTTITSDNYINYINPTHDVKCVFTGEKNNITIVDFDNIETYNKVLELFPNLKNYRTIKTKRGYHVYCIYDAKLLTRTKACSTLEDIDIANDGHMVIGAGSIYKDQENNVIEYTDLGGEILEVPEIIKKDLKQNKEKKYKKIEIPIAQPVVEEVVKEEVNEPFTLTNQYTEIRFYIDKGCYNDRVISGEHIKWFTLGGMFLSVFSNELAFDLWERVIMLNGSEDKKKEYKQHFSMLKQIENDKVKAFNTLVKWAKQVNPDAIKEYKKIKKGIEKDIENKRKEKIIFTTDENLSEFDKIMNLAIRTSNEYDVASLLNELYKNKFITTNISEKQIFELTDNLLWNQNGYNTARNYLSTTLFKLIELKQRDICLALESVEDQQDSLDKEEQKEALTKQFKNTITFSNKLKKTTDKNNIIREFAEITFNPDFLKKMNKQVYLLPLKNTKIFNLMDNTVRDRTTEDIFNFECDVEYLEEFDESFAEKYFNDLFCNKKDLIQVVLNIVKSCMCGKPLRYIFFLTGDGNNGKSLFFELLKDIFGNFIDTISRSVILTTKATTHLSTEFEKLAVCRIGYISEMSEKDELNVPIVKQMTGDRYVNVRGICKSDETIELISNLFSLTNKMPQIKVEKAINNRLVIIPFMNSFELNDEYKPILFSHKNEIFNYIMRYGKVQTKFDLTEDMINSKQECIEDNTVDELQTFIDEKCNLIDGKKILRNEFIKTYNDWLIKNHKDKDKRTTNKFTRDMKKTYKIDSKESNSKVSYLNIDWKFVEGDEED